MLLGLMMNGTALADDAWLEKSRSILEDTRRQPMPDWLQQAMRPKANVENIRKPDAAALGLTPQSTALRKGPIAYIFVSQSMGTAALQAIIEENRGHKDRILVFRGLPEGMGFMAFVGSLRTLLAGVDRNEMPPIGIDPERFTRNGISRVPAILIEAGPEQKTLVHGISRVDWLLRQAAANPDQKDWGIRGATVPIAEPNLLEKVKQRFRTFDWASYQKTTRDAFWQTTVFESLPEAQQNREFWVDPSVTAPRDIRDSQGRLIVFAGQRVNPLNTLPFHQKIIVFNPTRTGQIQLVRALIKQEPHRRITLIATEMDRSGGWQAFEKFQQQLGARVFLLTPDLRRRFKLSATPSVIEAEQQKFRICELGIGPSR